MSEPRLLETVTISLDREKAEELRREARRRGLKLSTYCRMIILTCTDKGEKKE